MAIDSSCYLVSGELLYLFMCACIMYTNPDNQPVKLISPKDEETLYTDGNIIGGNITGDWAWMC